MASRMWVAGAKMSVGTNESTADSMTLVSALESACHRSRRIKKMNLCVLEQGRPQEEMIEYLGL